MAKRATHSDAEIIRMYKYWDTRAGKLEKEYDELEQRIMNKRDQLEEALDNFRYADSEIGKRKLRLS